MAIGLPLATIGEESRKPSHLKAAQSSLHLNGQSGLPTCDRPFPTLGARLLLIREVGPVGKPKGTRFMAPGKAIASPFFGPQLLKRVLVTVAFFRELGH